MNILPTFRVALRSLLRNKVRSLLTTLGIIMGIASVIAMMAVGEGATLMVKNEIKGLGDNLVMIFPGSMRAGPVQGGAGTRRTLTMEDGEALMHETSRIRAFSPVLRTSSQVVYQENNWATSIQGVSLSFPQVRSWQVETGDFFTASDERGGMRVAVLGQRVVKELFADDDPVGKTVRIAKMPFQVVGVMQKKGTTGPGMDQDDTVIIPWTTYRRVLVSSTFNEVDQLMVSLYSMDDLEATHDEFGEILRQRHHLAQDADDDFTVMDMTEITKAITSVSVIMTVLLTVIASISLLVGGIGIMNIMLVSVTERTREIGLRMAVGACSRDILLQFLVESTVLSLVGGAIGIALGAGTAQILSHVQGWPVLISPKYVIIAIGFAASVGIFFGFYPAWRAAKLDPIEALRYE
jgi:putative ABC transport system permease protein